MGGTGTGGRLAGPRRLLRHRTATEASGRAVPTVCNCGDRCQEPHPGYSRQSPCGEPVPTEGVTEVDRTWPDHVRCGCDRSRCAPAPACTVRSPPCRERAARYACRITTLCGRERRRRAKGVARDVGPPVHRRAGRAADRLRRADVLAGPGVVQVPLASGGRPCHRLALEGPVATVVPRGPCRGTHGLSSSRSRLRGTHPRDRKWCSPPRGHHVRNVRSAVPRPCRSGAVTGPDCSRGVETRQQGFLDRLPAQKTLRATPACG